MQGFSRCFHVAMTAESMVRIEEIEMCAGMFKDQAEVVVAQEEVQEKIDLVENEEDLTEEEELIEEEEEQ
nr:hypothetical protein [Tanacetum cinerariifolium]